MGLLNSALRSGDRERTEHPHVKHGCPPGSRNPVEGELKGQWKSSPLRSERIKAVEKDDEKKGLKEEGEG